jgi:hypothetical protein
LNQTGLTDSHNENFSVHSGIVRHFVYVLCESCPRLKIAAALTPIVASPWRAAAITVDKGDGEVHPSVQCRARTAGGKERGGRKAARNGARNGARKSRKARRHS